MKIALKCATKKNSLIRNKILDLSNSLDKRYMEKILRPIGKFWFPVICTICGLALLFNSFDGKSPQPTEVKIGAACILFVGVISMMFMTDLIKKPVRIAVLFISLIGAAYLLIANTQTVTHEIAAQAKAKEVKKLTVQALKDVRTALETYRDVKGNYTSDLNALKLFVENDSITKIVKIGALPDSVATDEQARELGLYIKMPQGMTAEQVKAQGLIVRDTIQFPVMEEKFDNESALKGRTSPFDAQNLLVSPVSKKPWKISVGAENFGGLQRPVAMVEDPEPWMGGEALKIGGLNQNNLNGNWDD
jgi:hypothetical protein